MLGGLEEKLFLPSGGNKEILRFQSGNTENRQSNPPHHPAKSD
jgi:hypothetical protein